jgi:hypothetical protein
VQIEARAVRGWFGCKGQTVAVAALLGRSKEIGHGWVVAL